MSAKLKILFFVEQNVTSRFYEAYFDEFYGNKDFEFYLFNLIPCPSLENQLRPYFKQMFSPPAFLPYRQQLTIIKKVFKKINPDIIHAHETIPAFYANMANILTRRKVRVIYHRHHSFYSNFKKRIMDQAASLFSSKIICVSEFSKTQAAREHPLLRHKLVRIYNGITLPNVVLQNNEEILFETIKNNPGCKILFLARLKPRKGHIMAVNIMEEVVKVYANATLYITGAGELEELIKETINKKGLAQNVILTGAVDGIKELLKIIDIVILPSESEAFSLTVLETLSQGKLLMASDLPSIREIIKDGENGVLIDPYNKKEWTNTLNFFIKNQEKRDTIALSGKKMFDSNFTMDKMANQMKKIYTELSTNKKIV